MDLFGSIDFVWDASFYAMKGMPDTHVGKNHDDDNHDDSKSNDKDTNTNNEHDSYYDELDGRKLGLF